MMKTFYTKMLEIFKSASLYPMEFIMCIGLAMVPTLVWFFLVGHKHKHRFSAIIKTFIAGMLSAVVILLYQHFWGADAQSFIFFSVEAENFQESWKTIFGDTLLAAFFIFLSVGFLEEFLKHWMVKTADHNIFESIDDVIEFSIIGALGFAFLENIGYFFSMIVNGQHEALISLFIVRSIFVVFIHVICSAIYGYFYGLGHFASPVLHDLEKKGKHTYIPDVLHKLFHWKKATVFRDEMATFGLILVMFLHGLYDFMLHVNYTVPVLNMPLHIIVLPMILVGGFIYLNYLLNKKEDQKKFGHIIHRDDFVVTKD